MTATAESLASWWATGGRLAHQLVRPGDVIRAVFEPDNNDVDVALMALRQIGEVSIAKAWMASHPCPDVAVGQLLGAWLESCREVAAAVVDKAEHATHPGQRCEAVMTAAHRARVLSMRVGLLLSGGVEG